MLVSYWKDQLSVGKFICDRDCCGKTAKCVSSVVLEVLKASETCSSPTTCHISIVVQRCVYLQVICWCFLFQRLLNLRRRGKWVALLSGLVANQNTESKNLDGNGHIILFIFHDLTEVWTNYSRHQCHLSYLLCGCFLAVSVLIPPHHLLVPQLSPWLFCDISIQDALFFFFVQKLSILASLCLLCMLQLIVLQMEECFSFLNLLCVLFPEHITKTTVGVAYTWSHVVNTHF